MDYKKEVIHNLLKKNILVSSDFLEKLDKLDKNTLEFIYKKDLSGLLILDQKVLSIIESGSFNINWLELEKAKAHFEKGDKKLYNNFVKYIDEKKDLPVETELKEEKSKVKVLFSYEEESKKRTVQDFVQFFNSKYKSLRNLLMNREELKNTISISRILNKRDKENIALIGMVTTKEITKNKNLIMTVEDLTGEIKVLVNKNKPELIDQSKEIVLDEVIGIVGVNGQNVVYANNILWPDIPLNKELKKSTEEGYVVFLSDLHIGSNNFLPEEFNRFLKWINGETGTEEQKRIAKKVEYVFVIGDLVDGVGIYPGQEDELLIKDIYEQYEECAKFLKQIPPHINMIICPGNHDAVRIAEPQNVLYKDFSKAIWELPNITMVSNPALVNIKSNENFDGFDVLLYHGYSFDYYVSEVDSIRTQGGYDRADLIMKFLLKRRHLAPTHTSTLYIPEVNKDPLVIDQIPDFFVTGHIHNKPVAANYKNITMLSCGCWQSKTSFQERVGHNPEPARVPIVNLQTREIKILKFS